jgi:beta-fructofuranosidase
MGDPEATLEDASSHEETVMASKTKLHPLLDGEFWLIGANPELSELITEGRIADESVDGPLHECVDHHIFQSVDGAWHLWGCIRGTPVGRMLYHWEAESLTESPWRQTGEIIRAEQEAGESLDDWRGEEWIQSPFVVQEAGTYYMFYGGHGTGADASGNPVPRGDPRTACQMCLMTSKDGRNWTRYRGKDGYSRLFIGPGETRDPCLIKIEGLWHMVYAGYHNEDPNEAGFYVRTSTDLIHWSDWQLVHQDRRYGAGRWDTECPHVVFREGYYYLFRTENYAAAKTHVFRSEDPFDLSVGDASDKYVGMIAVAAPEIIVDRDGTEYITSNHDLRGGTRLCRLKWERA